MRFTMSESTAEDKLKIALEKKDLGNAAFKSGQYRDALRLYHEAIFYVQGLEKSLTSAMESSTGTTAAGPGDEKKRPRTEADMLLVALYNNMSVIHLKLANWKRALESAEKALSKDEGNAKAAFRKAQAQIHLGERLKAIKLLEELNKAHPNDPDIARELYVQRRDEEQSEVQHEKAFKEAWKGKFSFNRDKP
ncbi:TPR-like protein [Calocera viscosa TUFC12733]|uniref:TPR-like protein n=1 Tax=Calocera viscosa (strain TUFC12733) TaxID=1330018 RepID=A0A167H297_CALVF|nr:TPR-like protein [Calocera viscosa TUFC12733]